MLVEVSGSSLRYDKSTKRNLYARYGVAEYWVIDVQGGRIFIYPEPAEDGYRQVAACAGDELVASRALPAIQIRVGSLFR